MEIKHECQSCQGTGLYAGFCEPRGTAVICHGCGGKGWAIYSYKEFTGRKRKPGVRSISNSRGTLIAIGVGAVGKSMTYEQFEQAIKP